jgi:hypothetical protein
MDMTESNEERNETRRASFDLRDPYETPLVDEAPQQTESPSQPEPEARVDTSTEPEVPEQADSSTDDGDELPPVFPVEMKESLSDYIDEDLAANVKALVDKVAGLEQQLKQERAKVEKATVAAKTADKFDTIWSAESVKYDGVLDGGDAKARISDAMNTIRAGFEASGKGVPDDTVLFSKAVSMEFGASMVEAREQQILDRVQNRQKQFVSRAQTTGRMQERPEDRAARAVARLMADRGIGL